MLPSDLKAALKEVSLTQVRYFETIGSTNSAAIEWVESGLAEPALVVANHQTQGRGRLERRWVTQAGAGLAFSLILPAAPPEISHLALFSPLGALALCAVLEQDLRLQPAIKWPNDVLLNGLKVSGILAEAVWLDPHTAVVVLGIGVNITPTALPPPEEMRFPATSVESAAGHAVERWPLLAACIQNILEMRAWISDERFITAWLQRLAYRDQRVQVVTAAGPVEGILVGITPLGDLRLKLDQGQEVCYSAGDVSLRPI